LLRSFPGPGGDAEVTGSWGAGLPPHLPRGRRGRPAATRRRCAGTRTAGARTQPRSISLVGTWPLGEDVPGSSAACAPGESGPANARGPLFAALCVRASREERVGAARHWAGIRQHLGRTDPREVSGCEPASFSRQTEGSSSLRPAVGPSSTARLTGLVCASRGRVLSGCRRRLASGGLILLRLNVAPRWIMLQRTQADLRQRGVGRPIRAPLGAIRL
jgi:hypothetical protein